MLQHALKLLCLFSLVGCGSLPSSVTPVVTKHESSAQSVRVDLEPDWKIQNLNPSEDEILIDGKVHPFSIDVHFFLHGTATRNYLVFFKNNNVNHHPLKVELESSQGTIDFKATSTWYAKANGKDQYVEMNLYKMEKSASGNTKITTLLKSIERKYKVVCDKEEFPLIRFFKRIFDCCEDI